MDRDKPDHYRVEDAAVVEYEVVTGDFADDPQNMPYPVTPVFRQLEVLNALEFEARDLVTQTSWRGEDPRLTRFSASGGLPGRLSQDGWSRRTLHTAPGARRKFRTRHQPQAD